MCYSPQRSRKFMARRGDGIITSLQQRLAATPVTDEFSRRTIQLQIEKVRQQVEESKRKYPQLAA